MELRVTTKRVLRVWWAYFWRNVLGLILVTILAMIIGVLAGLAGVDPNEPINKIFITTIGVILSLAATIVPIQSILGKDFGEFRLVLLSKESPPILSTDPDGPSQKREEHPLPEVA